ncbi:hypothetical protein GGU10DRAFT_309370 [Lentinula aff. detonsa]|uniref:Zn(2)-C6 fungal-type domain-containing protein n=1 Tax=Lentinula aff. detonsa TaxID=2804958 RepID=A0AA38NDJ2_9AGAR|nr:hypothetical protein GGU10DRAFT_309370 [Lentinula aff. detonsa]
MSDLGLARPPSPQPLEFRKKDGTYSKMRSHAGNTPLLPQTKLCPFCPAKFTRTTHLNRHLRNHTNERVHKCDLCEAQFTRSDLLSRHRRGCSSQNSNIRRKSCVQCTESKVKCDRELPCLKCASRGKECVYAPVTKKVPRNRYLTTSSLPQSAHTQKYLSDYPLASSSSSANPNDPSVSVTSAELGLAPPTDHRSEFSRDYTSITSTESSSQIPTNSHLVSLYNHDVFEHFFSGVFSTGDSPSSAVRENLPNEAFGEYLWGYSNPGTATNQASTQMATEENIPSMISPSTYSQPIGTVRQASATLTGILHQQGDNDKHYYLHLFLKAFIEEVPVVHVPSFSPEGKPTFLINVMQACGAMFVESKAAAMFISTTLKVSRRILSEILSRDSLTVEDELNVILAVVLLHTLGMFHEDAEERATSGLYHGKRLVMMIRRVHFISHVTDWSNDDYNSLPLEEYWRHWAWHEMSKRVLLLSYLQDVSQCIFFNGPSSYHIAELTFSLPCDNELWRAKSASEWWTELHKVSPYGSSHERLNCPTLPSLMRLVLEPRTPQLKAISYFAHWAVIHGVIGRLFTLCSNRRLPSQSSASSPASSDPLDQEIYGVQVAMHNWLQWWMKRPEANLPNNAEEAEPPFMQNPLPFYWLGQVALMAYQENLPPFDFQDSSMNLRMEVRFWQVKKWLRHIRSFLAGAHGHAPTILWDELMSMRLQSWQVNLDHPDHDDPHGLLGFFVQ